MRRTNGNKKVNAINYKFICLRENVIEPNYEKKKEKFVYSVYVSGLTKNSSSKKRN